MSWSLPGVVLVMRLLAGTATVHDNLARVRIVPDDYVNLYISFAGRSTAVADACNDFDADKQLGRTSKVYDISGIVGMFCRYVTGNLTMSAIVCVTPCVI